LRDRAQHGAVRVKAVVPDALTMAGLMGSMSFSCSNGPSSICESTLSTALARMRWGSPERSARRCGDSLGPRKSSQEPQFVEPSSNPGHPRLCTTNSPRIEVACPRVFDEAVFDAVEAVALGQHGFLNCWKLVRRNATGRVLQKRLFIPHESGDEVWPESTITYL
jgi:hypothetical protein